MSNRSFTWGLCAAASTALLASTALAGDPIVLNNLLTIDLSVANQVTITGTAGLSAATVTGSDGTGVYLQNFFTAPGSISFGAATPGATFTNVGFTANGEPDLYRDSSADLGLNIYSWASAVAVTFTTGTQAFTGAATFSLSSGMYAEMLAANTSGFLYFPADDAGDVSSASLIGTYSVIPTPGAAALIGLGGLTVLRRRRK